MKNISYVILTLKLHLLDIKDIISNSEAKESQLPVSEASQTSEASTRRNINFLRRRKTSTTEEPIVTTVSEIGETSALIADPSPALYYTKQPIDDTPITEVIPATANNAQDFDLANVAVTALTQLVTHAPRKSIFVNFL